MPTGKTPAADRSRAPKRLNRRKAGARQLALPVRVSPPERQPIGARSAICKDKTPAACACRGFAYPSPISKADRPSRLDSCNFADVGFAGKRLENIQQGRELRRTRNYNRARAQEAVIGAGDHLRGKCGWRVSHAGKTFQRFLEHCPCSGGDFIVKRTPTTWQICRHDIPLAMAAWSDTRNCCDRPVTGCKNLYAGLDGRHQVISRPGKTDAAILKRNPC